MYKNIHQRFSFNEESLINLIRFKKNVRIIYMYVGYVHYNTYMYMWRVSSQNGLTPFWSIWDIWDLSCWNIKKIIRKCVILLIITSKIFLYIYIMRKVSLERYYFVLYDGALTLKMSKMVLNSFCDKTLHVHQIKALRYNTCKYTHVQTPGLNFFFLEGVIYMALTTKHFNLGDHLYCIEKVLQLNISQ